MKLRTLLIACCMLVSASLMPSQPTKVAATPQEAGSVNAELKRSFGEVSEWVSKAADMVPAEKYNYRPVDSVRTFGQIVAHVTDAYIFFCARAEGKKVQWSDATEKGTTDKATVVPKLKSALEGCNNAYSTGTQVGPLIDNVGHTNLHYGNIVTYMRMMGMKPPSS
jgi:uncharacterized damage-inducible protein DinB